MMMILTIKCIELVTFVLYNPLEFTFTDLLQPKRLQGSFSARAVKRKTCILSKHRWTTIKENWDFSMHVLVWPNHIHLGF